MFESSDPGDIPPCFIRECVCVRVPALVVIFNQSLTESLLLSRYLDAIIYNFYFIVLVTGMSLKVIDLFQF